MKLSRKSFIIKVGIFTILITTPKKILSDEVNKMNRELRFSNLNEALVELKKLEQAKSVLSNTNWNLFQILHHTAQSIEYSMSGYPELKSTIFRKTIGKIVISIFSSRGYMSHDLNAPVPGAPEISKEGNLIDAFSRIYKAIEDFKNFTGELKPHLAYDNLTKSEYEKAHSMHIANHLSSVMIQG